MYYSDVIMGTMASQITSLTIVYSIVHSGTDQRKHQGSASLGFARGIHRVNSPHIGPVTWKMFPFDETIMKGFGANVRNHNAQCRFPSHTSANKTQKSFSVISIHLRDRIHLPYKWHGFYFYKGMKLILTSRTFVENEYTTFPCPFRII